VRNESSLLEKTLSQSFCARLTVPDKFRVV